MKTRLATALRREAGNLLFVEKSKVKLEQLKFQREQEKLQLLGRGQRTCQSNIISPYKETSTKFSAGGKSSSKVKIVKNKKLVKNAQEVLENNGADSDRVATPVALPFRRSHFPSVDVEVKSSFASGSDEVTSYVFPFHFSSSRPVYRFWLRFFPNSVLARNNSRSESVDSREISEELIFEVGFGEIEDIEFADEASLIKRVIAVGKWVYNSHRIESYWCWFFGLN